MDELVDFPSPEEEWESDIQWSARILGVDEAFLESLTPRVEGFFGQSAAKEQIAPFIRRIEAFPNTLILGRPGIGKTRMARWIASQRQEPFEEFLCPVNPDALPSDGIIMLDEAHRQKHPEWLWSIMESDSASVLAATTRPELLESAFKSRFILTIYLKRYTDESMIDMGHNILGMTNEDAAVYAGASAGNPRQLELILAVAKELGPEKHEAVLKACRITGDGLTEFHVDVLKALQRTGRPIGLSSLASVLYSDEQTVREHEQLLVEYELVSLLSNGRVLSRQGTKYLIALEQMA